MREDFQILKSHVKVLVRACQVAPTRPLFLLFPLSSLLPHPRLMFIPVLLNGNGSDGHFSPFFSLISSVEAHPLRFSLFLSLSLSCFFLLLKDPRHQWRSTATVALGPHARGRPAASKRPEIVGPVMAIQLPPLVAVDLLWEAIAGR